MNDDATKPALLVVDMQPDFMPGGGLPVEEGDALVAPIAALLESDRFAVRVATQDWHPPDHVSFASNHPGHAAFETIELYGHEQTLWPDHCVQDTAGAALHADLPAARFTAIVRKATDPRVDSYSAFRDNWGPDGTRPPTGLTGYLRDRGIEAVTICGLARDYCVAWSAEDAVEAGFRTTVLWDLTRPIDAGADVSVTERLALFGVIVESRSPIGPE